MTSPVKGQRCSLVDSVHVLPGAEEAAVASVALVGERVASGGALHHARQLEGAALVPQEVEPELVVRRQLREDLVFGHRQRLVVGDAAA